MENIKPTKDEVKKSKLFLLIFLILPVIAFVAYIILNSSSYSYDKQVQATKSFLASQITYEVKGTGTEYASVTFEGEEGTSQISPIKLPWRKTLSKKAGDFLYISAQNEGEVGCIDVYINKGNYFEGEWNKHSQSCGRFVIASTQDRL